MLDRLDRGNVYPTPSDAIRSIVEPSAVLHLHPTFVHALREAVSIIRHEPAILIVDWFPPMPENGRYTLELPQRILMGPDDNPLAKPVHPIGYRGSLDVASACAIAQMAAAYRLRRAENEEGAELMTEAAAVTLWATEAGCETEDERIFERIQKQFEGGPETIPWPSETLWPDDVESWVEKIGAGR